MVIRLASTVLRLGIALLIFGTPTSAAAQDLNEALGYAGGKSITTDEARRIAEEAAGRSLADARFEESDLGAMVEGRFILPPDADGTIWQYHVDMTHGTFSSWISPNYLGAPASGDDVPVLTPEAAVDATVAEARKHLGDEVDGLEWKTGDWLPAARGRVSAKSDDLRLQVMATFDLMTGRMCSYWQMALPAGPDHEPTVTLEEATETVRARMGGGDMTMVREPKLVQAPNMPVWSIRVATPERGEAIFLVDAFTGEVVDEGRFAEDRVPAPARPDTRSHPAFPWPLAAAAIGAAVLFAAGLGVLILKRRR